MKPIAIDLGLSVRWADRNLGAEDIYLPGTLFQPSTRSRSREEEVAVINGVIRDKLGGKWRLPTVSEVIELQKSCKIWPAIYWRWANPEKKTGPASGFYMYKVKGTNGKYCYFNRGYHLFEGEDVDSDASVGYEDGKRMTIGDFGNWWIFYPYYNEQKSCPDQFQKEEWYGRDYIPYGYYYKYGLPIRPVTDEMPSRRDKFIHFFEYNTWDSGDSNIEVEEKKGICFLNYDKYRGVFFEESDEVKRERENERYWENVRREEREEEARRERQRNTERSISSSSTSQYGDYYQDRERDKREEEEQRKRERLEDWYREYVTIDVDLEYHCIDGEYNSDYWDCRNHEVRVTRREAMALVEAGENAIINRIGYYGNRSLIRNVRYQTPYGLYDRPWGC